MGCVDDRLVKSSLRLMTKTERFEFVLGKAQDFEVTKLMESVICGGLPKMYNLRKGILYDGVFQQ